MVHVAVPIDTELINTAQNRVFALATPMRVGELIRLAVIQALGKHAPEDKRERVFRTTLEGLETGRFSLDIDGRHYDNPESYVVCSGSVALRFFARNPQRFRSA